MADLFTRLANGVEAHLRKAFAERAWAFALVPDPLSLLEWQDLARSTPLITLAVRGFKPSANAGRRAKGTVTLVAVLVAKNERGAEHRFKGDARGPGLFPAADMFIRWTHGHTIEGLATLFVASAEQSYADGWSNANAAMARFEIEALVEFDAAVDPEELDDFLRLQNAWTAPALAQDVHNVRDPI